MIFWATWMFGLIVGAVCLGAAMELRPCVRRAFLLACSYFGMASGVLFTLLDVPL